MNNILRLTSRYGLSIKRPAILESLPLFDKECTERLNVYDPGSSEFLYSLEETSSSSSIDNFIQNVKQIEHSSSSFSYNVKMRSEAMEKWAGLVADSKEDLAIILALEGGKIYGEAVSEVESVIATIKAFSKYLSSDPDIFKPEQCGAGEIRHVPLGTHYCITPWNFPASMVSRKICPPLAAGCPVIVKPDHRTPLICILLTQLAVAAGFPSEAISCVITRDPQKVTTQILSDSSVVQRITFTGSTTVGKSLASQAGLRSVGLELGGSAPFIVDSLADLESAVAGVVASRFRHSGQTCICANRLILNADIYDHFLGMLCERLSMIECGMHQLEQRSSKMIMGPLIDKGSYCRLKDDIETARVNGSIWQPAWYKSRREEMEKMRRLPPTLIFEEPHSHTRHEIFGPVLRVVKYSNLAEAVELSQSPYGLAAYVYSSKSDAALVSCLRHMVGMVGVNTVDIVSPDWPFTGCYQSGHGCEGRPELAVRESMRVSLVVSKQV
jgi:succinate-semialdehyde dehydrogenase/glutarate-semialdehyde dehydrogenase